MRRCRGCGARSATAPLCRFGMVGSAGAVGREDAAVVGQHWWVQVLVDMGFPPGRARQELAAHRSVEEAVEALTPPQWQALPAASAAGGRQERSIFNYLING